MFRAMLPFVLVSTENHHQTALQYILLHCLPYPRGLVCDIPVQTTGKVVLKRSKKDPKYAGDEDGDDEGNGDYDDYEANFHNNDKLCGVVGGREGERGDEQIATNLASVQMLSSSLSSSSSSSSA